jgi:hypothetical protein
VAAYPFCGRVHHDICAMLNGLDEVPTCTKCVVYLFVC